MKWPSLPQPEDSTAQAAGSDAACPASEQSPSLSRTESGQGWGRLGTMAVAAFVPKDKAACLNWTLRFLVGGAFVLAGALKIADPAKFADDVSHYRLVPYALLNLVAILLPWIEVVAGLFVLVGVWLRASACLITCLTALFFGLIVSALARGLNIECGCFGTLGGKHVGLVNLAIDSTLFLLAALLASRSKDGPPGGNSAEAGARNPASSTPGIL